MLSVPDKQLRPGPPLRCAVYARTSSNEEATQEFGSIEAQREAGLAFIASQREMHWSALDDTYKDADVSGATLDRAGLNRLIRDIEQGVVNVVVVQKIDRLTRRMLDFVRLMEVFDKHDVALVSVSQNLNSKDPMGRLAIHTMMTFAQFEREIIGERIHDKLTATRRKGLWMGSVPPLGYDVRGQTLLVNSAEAELVQTIFRRFIELKSTSALVKELHDQGATTKAWSTATGKLRGGKPIDKNYLYKLLNNRMLVGELYFDGDWKPGKHEPIITHELWTQVRTLIDGRNRTPHQRKPIIGNEPLLKGLIFAQDGRAFSHWCSSPRNGRSYSYYIAQKDIAVGAGASGLPRFRAYDLEKMVVNNLRAHFRNPTELIELLPQELRLNPNFQEDTVISVLASLDAIWDLLFPKNQYPIVRQFVQRVVVGPDDLIVQINVDAIIKHVYEHLRAQANPISWASVISKKKKKKKPIPSPKK